MGLPYLTRVRYAAESSPPPHFSHCLELTIVVVVERYISVLWVCVVNDWVDVLKWK